MTEPTAEQIAAEMPRAREALGRVRFSHTIIGDDVARSVATALARVRKEAHAAGRDEGLGAAEKMAMTADDCMDLHFAIGALRGRT